MVSGRSEKEHRFWNALALLFFVGLSAIAFWAIFSFADIDVDRLGFLDLALVGLATFRLIHLITYDRILDFARVAVMDRDGSRLKAAERGWRRVVCELMQCLWCTGMWSAVVVVTAYSLGAGGRLAILILAVAGLGSLLQVVSKAISRDP